MVATTGQETNPVTQPDAPRREFLSLATGAAATMGVVVATWPIIDSLNPSADIAALARVEVNLEPIRAGERITVKWRGQPVFIDHRTPERIAQAEADDGADLRDPEPDSARRQRPEWLILVGVCTHLGCVPLGQGQREKRGDFGGWFCSCHGSEYDTSGRIRKGPAPKNLAVPPYRFVDDRTVRIG